MSIGCELFRIDELLGCVDAPLRDELMSCLAMVINISGCELLRQFAGILRELVSAELVSVGELGSVFMKETNLWAVE